MMLRTLRGTTWPPIVMTLRAESASVFPSADGATFALMLQRVGTVGDQRIGSGSSTVSVSSDGRVLTVVYLPNADDTAIPGEYSLSGEVVFSGGAVVRLPGACKWNAAGDIRLTVVDCEPSGQSVPAGSEVPGFLGAWVGEWVS